MNHSNTLSKVISYKRQLPLIPVISLSSERASITVDTESQFSLKFFVGHIKRLVLGCPAFLVHGCHQVPVKQFQYYAIREELEHIALSLFQFEATKSFTWDQFSLQGCQGALGGGGRCQQRIWAWPAGRSGCRGRAPAPPPPWRGGRSTRAPPPASTAEAGLEAPLTMK